MAKKQPNKAPKAPDHPQVRIHGKFPRFTFLRVARAFGYTTEQAAELFAVGVANGIIQPQGRIGISEQIEAYSQNEL